MANFEHKENRGSLFKNDKKETESHPDYRGQLNVGGQMHWVSAWLQESDSGVKYMSLSVQPRVDRPADDQGDDIPF